MVGQLVGGEALEQDLEGLVEALAPAVPVDLEEPDLDGRHARAHAELQPPVAEVVEHADLLDEPQRVVERQAVDERAEAQRRRALGRGGDEDARRRPVPERRAVVLGQVVGVEAGLLVALDEREALLELLADRERRPRRCGRRPRTSCAPPPCDVVRAGTAGDYPPARRTAGRLAEADATCRHGEPRASDGGLRRPSSGGGTRTHNPSINSRMLCRLSYPGPQSCATQDRRDDRPILGEVERARSRPQRGSWRTAARTSPPPPAAWRASA